MSYWISFYLLNQSTNNLAEPGSSNLKRGRIYLFLLHNLFTLLLLTSYHPIKKRLEMVTVRTSYLGNNLNYVFNKYVQKSTKLISNLNDRETNRSRTNAQSIHILYNGFLLVNLKSNTSFSAKHFFTSQKHDDSVQSMWNICKSKPYQKKKVIIHRGLKKLFNNVFIL